VVTSNIGNYRRP